MSLNLFDSRGNFIAPRAVIDQLSPDVRRTVEAVEAASKQLSAATAARADAEQQLKDVRADIAEIEKTMPRMSHTDLARAFINDSNRRRAGSTNVYG